MFWYGEENEYRIFGEFIKSDFRIWKLRKRAACFKGIYGTIRR